MDDTGDSNPFSSRFVRPGAIPFHFPADASAAKLVEKLAANGWRGQIIGLHGTGKSTLVHAVLAALAAADRQTELVTITPGQQWWRPSVEQVRRWHDRTVVVIDGYERLKAWARWRLQATCWRRRTGLLITAHRDMGFPLLWSTEVTVEVAQVIVRELQVGRPELIQPADVADSLRAREGNLREALFDLYDLYELRRPRLPS